MSILKNKFIFFFPGQFVISPGSKRKQRLRLNGNFSILFNLVLKIFCIWGLNSGKMIIYWDYWIRNTIIIFMIPRLFRYNHLLTTFNWHLYSLSRQIFNALLIMMTNLITCPEYAKQSTAYSSHLDSWMNLCLLRL